MLLPFEPLTKTAEWYAALNAAAKVVSDEVPIAGTLSEELRDRLTKIYETIDWDLPNATDAKIYALMIKGRIVRVMFPELGPYERNPLNDGFVATDYERALHLLDKIVPKLNPNESRNYPDRDSLRERWYWVIKEKAMLQADYFRRDHTRTHILSEVTRLLTILLDECNVSITHLLLVGKVWYGEIGGNHVDPKRAIFKLLAELHAVAHNDAVAVQWFERLQAETESFTPTEKVMYEGCLERLREKGATKKEKPERRTYQHRRHVERRVNAVGGNIVAWDYSVDAKEYVAILPPCAFTSEQILRLVRYCERNNLRVGDLTLANLRHFSGVYWDGSSEAAVKNPALLEALDDKWHAVVVDFGYERGPRWDGDTPGWEKCEGLLEIEERGPGVFEIVAHYSLFNECDLAISRWSDQVVNVDTDSYVHNLAGWSEHVRWNEVEIGWQMISAPSFARLKEALEQVSFGNYDDDAAND